MLCRRQLKCDGTRAETRFRLSAKRTSPFKSAGASVHSTTGSRGVHIGSSNAGYTMFRGSVKGTGYPLHSPVSPSLPLSCVTVCHHISMDSTKYSVCVTLSLYIFTNVRRLTSLSAYAFCQLQDLMVKVTPYHANAGTEGRRKNRSTLSQTRR